MFAENNNGKTPRQLVEDMINAEPIFPFSELNDDHPDKISHSMKIKALNEVMKYLVEAEEAQKITTN